MGSFIAGFFVALFTSSFLVLLVLNVCFSSFGLFDYFLKDVSTISTERNIFTSQEKKKNA